MEYKILALYFCIGLSTYIFVSGLEEYFKHNSINKTGWKGYSGVSDFIDSFQQYNFDLNGDTYSGSLFMLVIIPNIVMILCAYIAKDIMLNEVYARYSWISVIFFWIIRFLIGIFKLGIKYFFAKISAVLLFFSLILCVVLQFGINALIKLNENIFIAVNNLRDAIWIAAFIYIFKLLIQIVNRNMIKNLNSKVIYYDRICSRYKRLESKYGELVLREIKKHIKNQDYIGELYRIVITIILYEDYNRSCMIRQIENSIFLIKMFIYKINLSNKPKMTLGIMQYATNKFITNRESIILGTKKFCEDFMSADSKYVDEKLKFAISKYNTGEQYYREINEIIKLM